MVIMFPLDSVSPLAGVAAHQEPQSESGHLQAPAATENLFTRSASPLNTVHERGFTSSLAATAGAAHVHGCSQVTILQVCNSKLRLWCPQTWGTPSDRPCCKGARCQQAPGKSIPARAHLVHRGNRDDIIQSSEDGLRQHVLLGQPYGEGPNCLQVGRQAKQKFEHGCRQAGNACRHQGASTPPQAALRVWRQAQHRNTANQRRAGPAHTGRMCPSQAELSNRWERADRWASRARRSQVAPPWGRAKPAGPAAMTWCTPCASPLRQQSVR